MDVLNGIRIAIAPSIAPIIVNFSYYEMCLEG